MKYNVMEIPNGKSGVWEVAEFTVTEDDVKLENLRAMFKPGSRYLPAGTYKRLLRGGRVIMSNTPAEISDYRHFVRRATGKVLINGLGLGCVLADVLNKDDIIHVDVIEKDQDVINLVSPYFDDSRLIVHNADAYDFKPMRGFRYNAVWHDIWDNICADNLDGMENCTVNMENAQTIKTHGVGDFAGGTDETAKRNRSNPNHGRICRDACPWHTAPQRGD